HPSLHHRGHAWDRRHRPPADSPLPAQDRDRRSRREPRRRRGRRARPRLAGEWRIVRRRPRRRPKPVADRPPRPSVAAFCAHRPSVAAFGAHRPCDVGCPDGGPRGTARDIMISRVASLLLLLYALGFILFAFTLGKPAAANAKATDAAVVLTGGSGRIEHAID